MTASPVPKRPHTRQAGADGVPRAARRFGYTIAAGVNALLIWLINGVLEWESVSFLTEDVERVLPLITASLIVGVIVNLTYLWNDEVPVKPMGQIATNAIGLAVAIRVFGVFPFDFSAYDFPWSTLTRIMLIVMMIGTVIGIVVELFKLRGSPPPVNAP